MLALVLAVVAGVCLVVGWLLEQIVLVYAALGLSALGLLLVVAAVWRRRRSAEPESAEDDEFSVSPVGEAASSDAEVAEVAEEEPVSAYELSHEVFVERSTGERMVADATVHVLARRKRFHSADCRLVNGKQAQELTLVEAQEEDFTACSVCVEVGAAGLVTEQR